MGEPGNQSFGGLLRRHRRAAGLSQDALAQLAGLSVDAIAGLERGRRSAPHADTLRRLVRALDLSVDERNLFVRAADPATRASAAGSPIPRNLPVSLSSFIGRTEALVALRRLLTTSSPETRLLTLVGPGGIGKTRLALEIARSLLDTTAAFADGVWLTDLSPLDDPEAVPGAVGAALETGGLPSSTTDALVRTIGDRRLLLVLDNCEHLIDACVRLADALLRTCPNVAILATSREALAIHGEVVWPVSALSLADVRVSPSPDDVLRSEAGRLFVERASAVAPDFSLSDDNAATVAELCQQLDGIPLAIELAAARVNAFDVHTIVTRLADRLLLLRSGDRLAPPRHQTLQSLVQWSYDLLAPEEQRLFARLAVFAGGWDVEAVEGVAADDRAGAAVTLDLLGRLVDKSLVMRVADRAGVGRTRYRLLETLRQFAALPLAASGDLPRLRERHASYYLAALEHSEPDIEGPRQAERLRQLEQDIDNLRAALEWCVAADEAEPALRGSWSLAVLAWLRGYLEEVDGRLAALLELPSALAAPVEARAKALVATGYVAFYRGQLERAHRLVEDGLEVFRGLERARETGQGLVWFGLIVDAEGDHERSRRCFVEALQIFRERGDAFWIARAATNLGRCLAQLGDVPNAIPLLQEALALRRQLGDRRGVANTLHHLADALEGSGDLRQARDLAAEALSIAQAVGDRFVTVRALIGLGRVAYALDDLSLATTHLEQAMAIARGDAFGHEVAEVAVLLGFVGLEGGDSVRARELADDGLRTAQRHNRRVEAARALFLLGAIARCEAQRTEARARFRESAVLYQQVSDPSGVALAIAGLATVLDAGDHASHLAGAAEAVLQNGGTPTWTIERHALRHALAELRRGQSDAEAWANGRSASLDEIVAQALSG